MKRQQRAISTEAKLNIRNLLDKVKCIASVCHILCLAKSTVCIICDCYNNFHICTVHLDIIKVLYSPTNAQVIVLKNNIKIYIKIAPYLFWCSHTIFRKRIIHAC